VFVTDSATTPETANSVNSIITVQNTCTFTTSNSAVSFGSLNPGQGVATDFPILVTNIGAISSNILVEGTTWVYNANSFGATNTVWDWQYGTSTSVANTLSATETDTLYSLGSGASKDIYFGVKVPAGEPIGAYSQTEDIISSC